MVPRLITPFPQSLEKGSLQSGMLTCRDPSTREEYRQLAVCGKVQASPGYVGSACIRQGAR